MKKTSNQKANTKKFSVFASQLYPENIYLYITFRTAATTSSAFGNHSFNKVGE